MENELEGVWKQFTLTKDEKEIVVTDRIKQARIKKRRKLDYSYINIYKKITIEEEDETIYFTNIYKQLLQTLSPKQLLNKFFYSLLLLFYCKSKSKKNILK